MPFLTEEIWHALYNQQPPAKSIALTRYPQPADFPADPVAAAAMTTMQDSSPPSEPCAKTSAFPKKNPPPSPSTPQTES